MKTFIDYLNKQIAIVNDKLFKYDCAISASELEIRKLKAIQKDNSNSPSKIREAEKEETFYSVELSINHLTIAEIKGELKALTNTKAEYERQIQS